MFALGAVDGYAFLAAVLIGLSLGAEIDLLAYLATRYFGLRSFGSIYGLLFAAILAGTATGPVVFGLGYEITGSYVSILAFCVGVNVLAVLLTVAVMLASIVSGREPTQMLGDWRQTSGLWSLLLRAAGVEMVTTDVNASRADDHAAVEAMEAEAAVRSHRECEGLLFVWPPFRSDAAFRALRAFKGDRVVYAGDRRFTGDGELQEALEREWRLVERLLIPAWPGLDDYVYLFERASSRPLPA